MADQDFQIRVVTTADTAGLVQTKQQMDQLASQMKAAQFEGYQLGQALRVIAGGAIIAGGYKFVSDLRAAAVEIDKISAELGKQGNQIVKNSQQFAEMAKNAKDTADLVKIGEAGLKGVESAQAEALKMAEKELTTWQKIQDVWTSGFDVFNRGVARPQADALKLQQEMAAQNLEMARAAAGSAIQLGLELQAQFERLKSSGLDEAVSKTTDKLKEAQEVLKHLNPKENLESWIAQEKIVERLIRELAILANLQKSAAQAGQPTSNPGILQNQLAQFGPGGGTNLTPLEEKQARDAYINTQKELRDTQIANEKKARDDQAQMIRDRYEKGFPGATSPLPGGANQIETNNQILKSLNQLNISFDMMLKIWR